MKVQEYQVLRDRLAAEVVAMARLADDLYAAYNEDFQTRTSAEYRVKLYPSYRRVCRAITILAKALTD